jgi:(1->4)-alpha-D-glucan 1-alpha-D-glucosylmutase
VPTEPRATYRVQLGPGFGFDEATEILSYLDELGISHLYTSPYLQAAPGSTHGYDVVDCGRLNEELGGPDGRARMVRELTRVGMGQLVDVVPNHMEIGAPGNRWWWDVLENGPASAYADYFDIDWDPPEARSRNTVLLPVLPDHYGRVLERGDIRLERDGGRFTVRHGASVWPVSPTSIDGLLAAAATRCGSAELAFIADAHARLPLSITTDRDRLRQRHRDKEVLRSQLGRLADQDPEVRTALDAEVAGINADPEALDALLDRQNYRLAYWRMAARDLGYRRFFDVNHLVAMRVEDERVFDATHELVLAWVAAGEADGLRIDHADGLRDPEAYLARIAALAPRPWIVVEKILGPDESLPRSWPVDGTTGYDFMARAGGLFVDPAGEGPLTRFYAEFTGEPGDYPAVARESKAAVLAEGLGSDLNRLTALFLEVCERHRRHRDYTRHELHEALREVVVHFPVYRSYLRATPEGSAPPPTPEDERSVRQAVEAAKAARGDLDPALFDFFADLMLLRVRGPAAADLVMRFQQLTGPAMAKGAEDTAFYRYNRLVSLNEVGGDPGRFGTDPAEFHRRARETAERWPRTLLATSTHDTKRSEDVRARLNLLSEIPARWEAQVRRWSAGNERYRRGGPPDRNDEYLFYQTVVGAWPIEPERAAAYMRKAVREAKRRTSWTRPDEEYENALRDFVHEVLSDRRFTTDIEDFVAPLVGPGRVNSLSLTLLKLVSPGVPDFYQGTELWDLSLVDPDNRRPVDYGQRRRALAEVDALRPEQILARADEGLPKLWLIRQGLALRRRSPGRFGADAVYRPLQARGSRARHVLAVGRGDSVLAVAPRLVLGLSGVWGETTLELPPGQWTNVLTGERGLGGRIGLAELLSRFPVSLLARDEPAPRL